MARNARSGGFRNRMRTLAQEARGVMREMRHAKDEARSAFEETKHQAGDVREHSRPGGPQQ